MTARRSGEHGSDLAERATEFFRRWSVSHEEMLASFRREFTPATVWDQRPIPRITGADDAVRFLRIVRRIMGLETIDVEVVRLAVDRNVVLTERVDTFRRADRTVISSAALAGVLTYQDGQLVYWREYFDAGTFVAKTMTGLAGGLLGSARRRVRIA